MFSIPLEELETKYHDENMHLLDTPSSDSYLFAWNSQLAFATKSENAQFVKRHTALLEFIQSVELSDIKDGGTLRCDFIILKSAPTQNFIDTFIRLCSSYSSERSEPLETFFDTLAKLFKSSHERTLDVVGLFGELAVIEYFLREHNTSLEQYWQIDGNYSKYDFTLPNLNLEVKSSIGYPFTTEIKHSQIFNKDRVYLATCSLENNSSGKTVFGLINELKSTYQAFKDFNSSLMLEERLLSIPPKEGNIRLAVIDIKFFDTLEINQFPEIPERITKLRYTFNTTDLPTINPQTLIGQ